MLLYIMNYLINILQGKGNILRDYGKAMNLHELHDLRDLLEDLNPVKFTALMIFFGNEKIFPLFHTEAERPLLLRTASCSSYIS